MNLLDRVQSTGTLRRAPRATQRISSLAWLVTFVLLGSSGSAPGVAWAGSKEQLQSLDEQVQEIKSDVLGIAADLTRLEERLLYPSDTQVAVFVSLAEGETFLVDSVQIRIDGEPVAHHIYSFKELEALKKGGVQRIYTGNVRTGEHRLEVSVAGKRPGGQDATGSQSFGFSKDVGPKLVGVTLAGSDSGEVGIELGGF
ncbi:MAG: hypothetical protein WEF50_05195 [Myxococcota bacterium]